MQKRSLTDKGDFPQELFQRKATYANGSVCCPAGEDEQREKSERPGDEGKVASPDKTKGKQKVPKLETHISAVYQKLSNI